MYEPSELLVYFRVASYILVGFVSVMFLISDDESMLYHKAKTFLISKLMISTIMLVSGVLTIFNVDTDIVRDFWLTPTTILWAVITLYLNFKKELHKGDKIVP